MKRLVFIVIVLALIMIGLWYWASRQAPLVPPNIQNQTTTLPVGGKTVSYACKANKTITATFYEGQPTVVTNSDQPPVPGGSAHVVLDDGRTLDLKRTMSADGIRYSNGDPSIKSGMPGAESFVFWSKGNGAIVLENNVEKNYIGCIEAAPDTGTLPKVYTDEAGTFSIRLPQGYAVDESYQYELLGPGMAIPGIKFTIPKSLAAGTNLSTDSYLSVERLPQSATAATASCTADKFLSVNLENPGSAAPQTISDPLANGSNSDGTGTTYSYLTSMEAAAGNRYEQTVYAIPGSRPCTAVRYFIHYGAFENYPAGSIKQFDAVALKATFDQIRESLVVNG